MVGESIRSVQEICKEHERFVLHVLYLVYKSGIALTQKSCIFMQGASQKMHF